MDDRLESAKLTAPQPTIRFRARLAASLLTLPKAVAAKLPRGEVVVEAIINGFPFRAALEPGDGSGHCLKVNNALLDAAGATAGDTVTVEITRVGNEPEIRVPVDLHKTLAASPRAQTTWMATTSGARRDWILWLSSGKLEETRSIRIQKACSMLAAGKKRICCFGGLSWLRKNHPAAAGTWLPLPKSR